MLKFQISAPDHCRQVEGFLHVMLPTASPAYVRKLSSSGNVSVNGLAACSNKILRLGDTVTIKESGKTKALLNPVRADLEILFEDSWIVVFNKAPGLPMHRTAAMDDANLVEVGTLVLNRRDGGNIKLRPVNRLDRGTSGAVILAKSSTAAGMFGRHLKEEGLDKLYLAMVDGNLNGAGTITLPLEGKDAETRYKTLFSGNRQTIVAVYPITGRMHQIRLHFKSLGYPICGDRRYGGSPLQEWKGHALHSFRSSLVHPATGEELTFYAPLPQPFVQRLELIAGGECLSLLQALPDLS